MWLAIMLGVFVGQLIASFVEYLVVKHHVIKQQGRILKTTERLHLEVGSLLINSVSYVVFLYFFFSPLINNILVNLIGIQIALSLLVIVIVEAPLYVLFFSSQSRLKNARYAIGVCFLANIFGSMAIVGGFTVFSALTFALQ